MKLKGVLLLYLFLMLFAPNRSASASLKPHDSLEVIEAAAIADQLLRNNNDSALKVANLALEKARALESPYLEALIKDVKSTVLQAMGNWKEATPILEEAIRTFANLGRTKEEASAILHLGNIYFSEAQLQLGDQNFEMSAKGLEQSLKNYTTSLRKFSQVNDSDGIGRSYYNIAAIHYHNGDLEKSAQLYKRAAEIYKDIGSTERLLEVESNLAIVYEALGQKDSAMASYTFARQAAMEAKKIMFWININSNMATFMEETEPKRAVELLLEADSLCISANDKVRRADVQSGLFVVLYNQGKYRQAIEHLENHYALKDSIINTEFKTEELKVRYESAKQKEQIEHQRAENLQKELELERTESEKKQLTIVIGIVALCLFGAIGFYFWRQRTRSIIQQQREELHQRQLEDLERAKQLEASQAMLAGQEKERMRMAEDLHDRLGSTLAAARMQFEVALNKKNGAQAGPLSKAQILLDRAINDTRSISHKMVSGVLTNLGLAAALRDLKESMEVAGRINIDLNLGELPSMDSETELQLFRITQEAVGNSIRHSKATLLTITLEMVGEQLVLKIKDNGHGFDPETAERGLGLQNIERRSSSLKADFFLNSSPEKGTEIIVKLKTPHETTENTLGR